MAIRRVRLLSCSPQLEASSYHLRPVLRPAGRDLRQAHRSETRCSVNERLLAGRAVVGVFVTNRPHGDDLGGGLAGLETKKRNDVERKRGARHS